MAGFPYTDLAEDDGRDESPKARRADSLRARVHDEILQRIRSGALAQAERLVDTEIAAQLGVSRMPAREALMQLVSEGYLVGTTRGFMRPRLTMADVAEIFEVRRLLEPRAAAHAARDLDATGLSRLRSALEDARAAMSTGEADRFFQANVAFRDGWMGAVSNSRLTASISRFVDHVQIVRLTTLSDPTTQPLVVAGLARLFAAFERGDSVAAEEAMARFIDTAEERFGLLAATLPDGAIDFARSIAAAVAAR